MYSDNIDFQLNSDKNTSKLFLADCLRKITSGCSFLWLAGKEDMHYNVVYLEKIRRKDTDA